MRRGQTPISALGGCSENDGKGASRPRVENEIPARCAALISSAPGPGVSPSAAARSAVFKLLWSRGQLSLLHPPSPNDRVGGGNYKSD